MTIETMGMTSVERQALRDAWRGWVHTLIGNQTVRIVTLTFRDRVVPRSEPPRVLAPSLTFTRRALQAFTDKYAQMANGSEVLFLVEERGDITGRYHGHCLAEFSGRTNDLINWWREKYGFVNDGGAVQSAAAIEYVTKYVTKGGMGSHWWIVERDDLNQCCDNPECDDRMEEQDGGG